MATVNGLNILNIKMKSKQHEFLNLNFNVLGNTKKILKSFRF